jgi:hypothetical protein
MTGPGLTARARNDGAVLELQHLAQSGDVIGQRGQRELWCGDVVAVGWPASSPACPWRSSAGCGHHRAWACLNDPVCLMSQRGRVPSREVQ